MPRRFRWEAHRCGYRDCVSHYRGLVRRRLASVVAAVVVAAAAASCAPGSIREVACPGVAAIARNPDVSRPLMCPQLIAPRTIRYIYIGGPGCVLTRQVLVPDAHSVTVDLADASGCRASLEVGALDLRLPRPVSAPGELTARYETRGKNVVYRTRFGGGS
jgi:hypothetical protein